MIKHHGSKRSRNIKDLRAKFRMALTGTPMDGRLEELHSVMQFVAPGLLCSKVRFFQRYVETDFWGRVTGYKRLGEVSKKIQPFFLRRLKKDVLADLPDKIYENRFVLLTPEERKIYDELAEHGHAATEDVEAIVAIIRCKQFCNWPVKVDEDCKSSSKMDAFKEVLDEVVLQNGHKVLVFSQYKEMLDVLVGVFDDMGLKYLRIDGDTQKARRVEMQKEFNEDKTIDAMIGTEAMSAGLNFTAADFVLNYDDNWSPAIMAQREDRCHRIGQRNVVTVVNFVCKDTVEERIRAVIYQKNKITSKVLGDETDDLVLQRLGPKDVARLL
jgi:SNF2 family DNA or RNA helicase